MKKILMSLFLFLGLFISAGYIHAASLDPSNYITSAEINPQTFNNGQTITITYHYKDNEPDIKGGDTMYIPLPKSPVYVEGYESSQVLKNSKGVPMAIMNVSHDGITLKFLDSVNNMQPDTISGTMTVYASVYSNSSSSNSGQQVTVPLVPGDNSTGNPTVTINNPSSSSSNTVNVGNQIIPTTSPIVEKTNTSNKDNVEGWQSIVCVSQLANAHFTDNVGPDLTIDTNSLQIIPINGSVSQGLTGGKSYTVEQLKNMGFLDSASVTGKSINLDFNATKCQNIVFQIIYNTNSTNDNTNPYYQNRLEVTGTTTDGAPFDKTVIATSKNQNASGTIQGTNQSGITFQKVDSSTLEPVPGATFEIASDENFTSNVETGKTDSNGMLSFNKLNDGTYYIKETSAPEGYQLNTNVYHFTITNGVASALKDSTGNKLPANIIYEKKDLSFSFEKVNSSGEPLSGAVFELVNNLNNTSMMTVSGTDGKVEFSNLNDGTYTLKEVVAPSGYSLSDKTYTVTVENGQVTTTLPSNNEIVNEKSSSDSSASSSSSKSSSSSGISSSLVKSSAKSSSSSETSSSPVKSSVKSSSNSEISSSLVKSNAKSSSSSEISSSLVKSNAKSSSSSEISSSLVKSSAKSSLSSETSSSLVKSSIKSSLSSEISSSLVKSSIKNSSSSEISSSLVKSSAKSSLSSEISSSLVKSSAKSSSSSEISSSPVKSSAKSSLSSEILSSLVKSSVKSSSSSEILSSSVKSSVPSMIISKPESNSMKDSDALMSSKSNMIESSNSISKPDENIETSVKVPSKISTISYVNKSTEVSIPVAVSSEVNTIVESSVSSSVPNGLSSMSNVYKPTLVSSSMDIPVRSWSNSIKDESSAVTTETTVSTYSTVEHSQNQKDNESSKKSTITGTFQNTAVHSTNQGDMVAGGNVQGGQSSQQDSKKNGEDNDKNKGLPQTGETAATAVIGLGIVLIVISGVIVFKKKNG